VKTGTRGIDCFGQLDEIASIAVIDADGGWDS
jgi:hypothetical protein